MPFKVALFVFPSCVPGQVDRHHTHSYHPSPFLLLLASTINFRFPASLLLSLDLPFAFKAECLPMLVGNTSCAYVFPRLGRCQITSLL